MYLHGGCNNVGVAMEMNFGQLHLSANSHEEQPSVIYCLERVLLASVLCQRPVSVWVLLASVLCQCGYC